MEHEAPAPAWVAGLEASGLGEAMRGSMLLYPVANVLHVLAVLLLVGPIVALDLRLLGIARAVDAAALDRYLTRFAYVALPVIALTGFALFSADARALAVNPAFLLKLSLAALGLANAILFRLLWRHRLALWDAASPPLGKIQAAGSIVVWLAAVAGGRLIAYV